MRLGQNFYDTQHYTLWAYCKSHHLDGSSKFKSSLLPNNPSMNTMLLLLEPMTLALILIIGSNFDHLIWKQIIGVKDKIKTL